MTPTNREPVAPATNPSAPPWSNGPVNIRSVSLSGIFVLMVMYTLYLAAPLFMPLTVAFLMSLVFAPVVRGLKKLKIPPPLSAAVILLALLGIGLGAVYALSVPASEWIQRAPQELRKLEVQLQGLVGPLEEIREARQQLEEASPMNGDGSVQSALQWSPLQWLLTSTWSVVYGVSVSVILLYFLLASGDTFLRKLVRLLSQFEDKRVAVETVHRIQRSIARFLGTITAINACLGTAAAGILYLIGIPNPVLFGVMVGLLNFAPYIGPLISCIVLLLVAVLSFDDVSRVVLAPALVFGLNVLEGQLITPTLAGKRLELSPVAVFLAITLWGWMWGVVGILIAVPLIASVKLVCDRIEPLKPVGEFMGS